MKDISLMEVNGDERFKLSTLNFTEVLSGDINEHVEHLQEDLVCVVHDLLVCAGIVQSYFSISGPHKLDPQNPNLCPWQNYYDMSLATIAVPSLELP